MTAHARAVPQRRGVCPGLSRPMPTGDGLLVRLVPTGTIPLATFAKLCAAARGHGNAIIEVTSRGSIQVRGLSDVSAPCFAAAVTALGIAVEDDMPIACNPLAGIAADEIFDSSSLAAGLRGALAQRSFVVKLNAKVSVAIDGGGQPNIAGLPADIRLDGQRMNDEIALHVSIGGDEESAAAIGTVSRVHGIETTLRLLEVIAQRGRDARARSILAAEGIGVFRAAAAEFLIAGGPARAVRQLRETIATHHLRDGLLACGIGLAFGHAEAASLERLVDAAQAAGASGVRAAPGRAVLIVDLTPETCFAFTAAAERLGFIVRGNDPRRRVVACAGAPICASAHIAARAIAPRIADSIAPYRHDVGTIHISGCAKGCAHAGPAALTVVGTADGCALVANGDARGTPFAVVPADELRDAAEHFVRQNQREAIHG